MSNRRKQWIRVVGAAAVLGAVALGVAEARGLLKDYRLRRMSSAPTMASPPFTPDPDAPDCAVIPGVPEIVGDSFDPGRFDQIDLAGNGRLVAYPSAVTAASPGTRAIVVLSEGGDPSIVAEASGDDDQPSLAFDKMGWRMAFRGSDGAAGETPSNVYLHTVTRVASSDSEEGTPEPRSESETRNLTNLDAAEGLFARDPSIAARTIVREIKSGVTVRERDARVAFVSNGDLDKGQLGPNADVEGKNPANVEQVFVWRERDRRFRQLTRNADADATMARPVISGNGRYVAFESDADLVPDAANPRDPAQVGNPDGVRQIYMWIETSGGGVLRQLTWSAEDCLAPRMTADGRFVLFCSRGDLLPGGNPDGNFEIFRWRRGASPVRSLAQLTETAAGHSVLPRPTRTPRRFVFYSTVMPAVGEPRLERGTVQCGPVALIWANRRVRLVHGVLDSENAKLIARDENPIVVGPPAAANGSKVHFATNDPLLNPSDETGHASLIRYHMARATRHPRR